MPHLPHRPQTGLIAGVALLLAAQAAAQEVNVYSSRHYDTDDTLYDGFTEATGIKVNRIEGEADELIARMKAEGANSPADVFLTVDAGRIWLADKEGLLQPVESEVLIERIPENLRHPENHWFGFSQRARAIFYANDRVDDPPMTYAALADPVWKGRLCVRSSSNIYNLSLLGAIIANEGEAAARAWAAGVHDNLARPPEGGDTDQLRGLVSGICDVALSNTYYFARALDQEIDGLSSGIEGIGWLFPDQDGNGAHINVAAAGVAANAPNLDNAVAFLEYLTEPDTQAFFANQNYEFPVVADAEVGEVAARLGEFRADTLNLSALGENQPLAQQIFNEVGFP